MYLTPLLMGVNILELFMEFWFVILLNMEGSLVTNHTPYNMYEEHRWYMLLEMFIYRPGRNKENDRLPQRLLPFFSVS